MCPDFRAHTGVLDGVGKNSVSATGDGAVENDWGNRTMQAQYPSGGWIRTQIVVRRCIEK